MDKKEHLNENLTQDMESTLEDSVKEQEGLENLQKTLDVEDLEESQEEVHYKKITELEDLVKRQAADFDNFRKRLQDEKERMKDVYQESIILEFLPIFDNIERAFEASQLPEANLDSIKIGLEGIIGLFGSFLQKQHIHKIDSIGQAFDPKVHEALFTQEGDYEKKEVIQEVEKAYTRKDKVLRTAKVGVGVPKN